MISNEWKEVKLGDCCIKIGSGITPKGGESVYIGDGTSLIRSQNIYDYRFEYKGLVFIDEVQSEKMKNVEIVSKDVLLNITGDSVARCCIVPEEVLPARVNQHVSIIRPKKDILNAKYLQYYLNNFSTKQLLLSLASTGGTRKALTKNMIENLKLILPPIVVQEIIAAILSCLDDKIELNKKINDNLLKQAQAVYDSIFITNSNPENQTGRLSELIVIRYGKDHKKLEDGEYPVFGSGGIMRYVERPLFDKESVLIPRKGTLNNVMYVNEPFWSVDTMFYTEMKRDNLAKFIYHFLSNKDLASLNVGSAVPSMTTDILNAMELIIPNDQELNSFEKLVDPMYRSIQENNRQSRNISAIRDIILPKLMSGEVDVSAFNI